MPVISNDGSEIILRTTANTSLIANNANYYRILAGTISQNTTSNTVTGSSTQFLSELAVGDYVRWTSTGLISRVWVINSDTSMVVTARPSNVVSNATYGRREPQSLVHGFVIDEMKFSGNWTIKRGANTILQLSGTGEWKDCGLNEFRNASLVLGLASGNGTIICKLKKTF